MAASPSAPNSAKSDLKIERRGKYPGVKVHLGVPECQTLIDAYKKLTTPPHYAPGPQPIAAIAVSHTAELVQLAIRIAKHVHRAAVADPALLTERTEEEIIAELEKERLKSEAKLKAIAEGKKWTDVKVD